ncbi:hypothetical protein CAPTEDRAFT_123524 [Capitella teleta]|uniref:G-protein coupled receptors family 1 profile domain-containing protein n=1 Tax=Capitella teleta TaxID=283909 RepID=R7UQY3_CAPTE|nr:hypothetical protein CAPTEDRAFT_123524 [Capitella teleta]|eukprot:ELU08523.1 hypothetical protein CAPTEDRAFT_123524 [Capitella teleta]
MAYLYLVVICTAVVSGTVGNSMVIAAVLITKKLKTVGNMFIVNLALADLCVTAFVDPFSIIGIILGEGWFVVRPVICETVASICLTSCFCSLLSIGTVSFNRYIHICHNELYPKIFTKTKSFFMCIALWVICFLAEMSCFIGWGDHSFDKKTLSCVWDRTADFSYTLFFALVGVAFPVTLISICYVRIYRFVNASKIRVGAQRDDGQPQKDFSNQRQESMRLARTLFIIFAVFAACWTPYAIIVVADRYDTYPMEIHIFSILVAHTNSSLNSILYGLTNANFREGYKQIAMFFFGWLPFSCLRRNASAELTCNSMTDNSNGKRNKTATTFETTAY